MRAERFSITPPDENHDYWFLMFVDETLKSDIHIEIEDMTKFKQELDRWVVVFPSKVSPPIPGGGTPTQGEKYQDIVEKYGFYNTPILTVKDVKE